MTVPAFRAGDPAGRVDFVRARACVLAAASPCEPQPLALDAAAGRILAATLTSFETLVPFARSAMDGYALRAADARPRTVAIPVRGARYAGEAPGTLPPGAAIAIATGAALPDGADAVVPFEDVEVTAGAIALRVSLQPGDHVFPPGDDARPGDVLAWAGDVLTPGRTALLAAAGHAVVSVVRKPRVAIVSTGNEVVDIGARPRPGEVRNSNAPMLAAFAAADGAEIVRRTHVRDEAAALRAVLRDAIGCSDLVITTGGASAGERDLVKDALRELGAVFAFESVALRPAKPTGFARCGQTLVAVLPGNPAAAFVAYAALARGAVRGLAGRTPFPAPVDAIVQGSIHGKADRHFVLFGELARDGDGFRVRPLDNQCSSLTRTAADAAALIVVPPGRLSVTSGEHVAVDVLDWDAVRDGRHHSC